MQQLTIGRITLKELNLFVQLQEHSIADYQWTQVENIDITSQEQTILDYITQQITTEPTHLLNEATIWARAIYPLLALAEQGDIHARAEVPLEAQYPKFQIKGIADGTLGKTIASRVVAPYLVVVEAKKGIEGQDPIPQLYGQLLAAAYLNWQSDKRILQTIFGAYTIADNWTFVKAEVSQFEGEQSTLSVEYSREYTQRYEGSTILKLLKSIVKQR